MFATIFNFYYYPRQYNSIKVSGAVRYSFSVTNRLKPRVPLFIHLTDLLCKFNEALVNF